MEQVPFVKFFQSAKIPSKNRRDDAGYDLYSGRHVKKAETSEPGPLIQRGFSNGSFYLSGLYYLFNAEVWPKKRFLHVYNQDIPTLFRPMGEKQLTLALD